LTTHFVNEGIGHDGIDPPDVFVLHTGTQVPAGISHYLSLLTGGRETLPIHDSLPAEEVGTEEIR
jgi:hypothetical protein